MDYQVTFSVRELSENDITSVSERLGLQPSRIAVSDAGRGRRVSWNYNLSAGNSLEDAEDRICKFILEKHESIMRLKQEYSLAMGISISDNEIPSLGWLNLQAHTLSRVAACGMDLEVAFCGPADVLQ